MGFLLASISLFAQEEQVESDTTKQKVKKKFKLFGKKKKKQKGADSLSLQIEEEILPVFRYDSLTMADLSKKELREFKSKRLAIHKKLKSPSKAALLSGILPGLGQIYNRKYWKVPIVAAGFGFLGYTIGVFNDRYIESRDNLFFATDNNDDTQVDIRFFFFTDENLRRRRDNARRDRDYYIILSALAYGLVVADAAVDGHLNRFDVTDDLSMTVKPTLIPMSQFNAGNKLAPGLSVVLTLK